MKKAFFNILQIKNIAPYNICHRILVTLDKLLQKIPSESLDNPVMMFLFTNLHPIGIKPI